MPRAPRSVRASGRPRTEGRTPRPPRGQSHRTRQLWAQPPFLLPPFSPKLTWGEDREALHRRLPRGHRGFSALLPVRHPEVPAPGAGRGAAHVTQRAAPGPPADRQAQAAKSSSLVPCALLPQCALEVRPKQGLRPRPGKELVSAGRRGNGRAPVPRAGGSGSGRVHGEVCSMGCGNAPSDPLASLQAGEEILPSPQNPKPHPF